jgi:hypothetical protein
VLVPNNRQIANRNLHVVNVPPSPNPSGMFGMGFSWPREVKGPITLSVSRAGMPKQGQLGLLLPPGIKPREREITARPIKFNPRQLAEAKKLGLAPNVAWMIPRNAQQVQLTTLVSHPGERINVGFYWSLGAVPKGSTWRFAAVSRAGKLVLGGNIYYLRVRS